MLQMPALTQTKEPALQINQVAMMRIKSHLQDPSYKESIEQSSSYNTRLCLERKLRLPFLDAQTGVAQSNCSLWMSKRHRMPGQAAGQLYTYPSKRWRKKRRQYLINFLRPARSRDMDMNDSDIHQINAVENPASKVDGDDRDDKGADSKDSWYQDYEDASEPPDAGEINDPESDYEDYEETYTKRKKRKTSTRGKRKTEKYDAASEVEKPFVCEACGARYKTRPGLTYHYTHSHNGVTEVTDDESTAPSPPVKPSMSTNDPLAGLKKFQDSFLTFLKHPGPKTGKTPATPSPYCDFCLGDASENKKTRMAEELVSCSDCGRSGHPTCLQFTPNMMISVKKYRWQCIECKCCTICGTSDNDDQLLFCDDCDRGYHMYCLSPPLSEPPEGSWSCHLCIEEFHKK
uniref:Uncharacterized protein n=1 Tax=Strigamia maritima TaxID=126957 RepID=T1J0T8_STRMM